MNPAFFLSSVFLLVESMGCLILLSRDALSWGCFDAFVNSVGWFLFRCLSKLDVPVVPLLLYCYFYCRVSSVSFPGNPEPYGSHSFRAPERPTV